MRAGVRLVHSQGWYTASEAANQVQPLKVTIDPTENHLVANHRAQHNFLAHLIIPAANHRAQSHIHRANHSPAYNPMPLLAATPTEPPGRSQVPCPLSHLPPYPLEHHVTASVEPVTFQQPKLLHQETHHHLRICQILPSVMLFQY